MSAFAAGKRALGICDRCGFAYKLHDLRPTVVNRKETGLLVCNTCWESDHPQNAQGRYPIRDAQALRNARPDTSDLRNSRGSFVNIQSASEFDRAGETGSA